MQRNQIVRSSQRGLTRGFALNVVMILSVMLVVLLATMLFVLARSAHTSGELLARKQTFFATDGMMRAVVKDTNDFFVKNPNANTSQLQASFTNSVLDSITPSGYTREVFNVTTTGLQNGQVPNGAFAGMNASLYPITASLKLRKGGVPAAARQDTSMTLAQISMFEFMVFIDTPYGDWVPGPPQNVDGRVHANGTICLAGGADFCIAKVTAAGSILQSDDPGCRYAPGDPGTPPFISKTAVPDFTTCDNSYGTDATKWGAIDSRSGSKREHGCTNCGGSGSNWASWAPTEFANNALDSDQGTPFLQLPITGTPDMQAGKFADNTVATNTTNARFLVDPVRASDAGDVQAQKYAMKADIRIIDGVWYVPDPSNAGAWPGLAIWSDHPGSYSVSASGGAAELEETSLVGARALGQADIRTSLAGHGVTWAAVPPRGYSYYEVDPATGLLADTTTTATGIVSYGNIFHAGAGSHYTPGFWPVTTANDLCPPSKSAQNVGFKSAFDTSGSVCSSGTNVKPEVALLAATRSGFRDGHVEQRASTYAGAVTSGSPQLAQKILPMNFDMAAFNAALANTAPGELGSIFCSGGGCLEGRPFNGIVWIGLTWHGSLNGFPNANPTNWPAQGALTNATQPAARTNNGTFGGSDGALSNRGLPYELCSTSLANANAVAATSANVPFQFPDCAAFNGAVGVRPNAVRVINADQIDTAADAGIGISIVSSLPVFVVGQFNTKDRTGTAINTTSQTATPWVPAMVGGDEVYLLSDAWDDTQEPWDVAVSVSTSRAFATPTKYNMEMLAGWSESRSGQYSGGIENFPHFIEWWDTGNTITLNGSLVVGFDAVYDRWPRSTAVYQPPKRAWAYDKHLNVIANQPPGTPQYFVYATKQWSRQ